ncbi:MAG: cation diffusion facilitator family transporter [Bryobacterales bacterium]|nr:cation diffusion facilitator family transporter [Bryobacteraceae bacterium]MDW8128903.1 cation diffusion facilitator family transporter [Bryobacterales bacterium]
MSKDHKTSQRLRIGRRLAMVSVATSAALAVGKIVIGWMAGSTSVVADGLESASDVVASTVLLFGLAVAAKPPDEKHPYGHGRFEMLTGLALGFLLAAVGVGIAVQSVLRAGADHEPPAFFGIWPLIASIVAKGVLSVIKLSYGRRIQSAALVADAWNDTVDILSGTVALAALGLTLYDPSRFLAFDHYGGFAVGLIVIFLGLRVVRETSLQLMDTMPAVELMDAIREVARSVPGVLGVEKCYARKTGLQYHVDLHLELDPDLTVRASHDLATQVRARILEELDWVADVMVHVEPYEGPLAGEREVSSRKVPPQP